MKLCINTLLFAVSKALDCIERDLLGVTTNHSKRVAYLSVLMSKQLGISPYDTSDLATCAILHDNALTEYMLNNSAKHLKLLENIEQHCILGEENSEHFPFLGNPKNIILHHHENWNGKGFFGCTGKEIIDRAAILRLADNTDLLFAMGTGAEKTMEEVILHVKKEKERIYAPNIVEAFLETVNDDMIHNLSNDNIDKALFEAAPRFESDISPVKLLSMSKVFSHIIDAKSRFTLNHSRGIARIASVMADYYLFDTEHKSKFIFAAHLHDIGKLSVPNSLLEKPGALTDEEFDIVRNHAAMTHNILSLVDGWSDIAEWASDHHEKLDGTGYPVSKDSQNMPFESRLLGCIDIYQALTEERPYRAGMSHAKAMDILKHMADNDKMDGKIINDMNYVLIS